MSLEQAIQENTQAIISLRDLILSGKFNITPEAKSEPEQKPLPKPAKKAQVKQIEDTPKEEQKAKAEPTPESPAEQTGSTEQEVIKSFIELAKTDREAAVAVLAQFRVAKAVDVPAESRCDFLKAVKAKQVEIEGA